MRNRLGGLNEHFFDLFLRALTFQPIRHVPEFVCKWLLEARPLGVQILQTINERINDLDHHRADVETRLAELDTIIARQNELQANIAKATQEANAICSRWTALRRDLERKADVLASLLDSPYFDEKEILRALLASIALLTAAEPPTVALFHWGDLDVGGWRILAHLRSQLGRVTPLAMDATTFDQFQTHAQKLNTIERDALTQLQSHVVVSDCAEMIQSMFAANRKLEQEVVDAERIIKILAELGGVGTGPSSSV